MSDRLTTRWQEPPPATLLPRWVLTVIVLLFIAGAGVLIFLAMSASNRAEVHAGITAVESRFTLHPDNGRLTSIDRQSNPEVWYRVTLGQAPVGSRLGLRCDWINPEGQVVHQNRYETRVIDRTVWPTHARYRFSPESAVGTWTVRISIDGRELDRAKLRVRAGEEHAAPRLEANGKEGGF